MYRLSNLKTKSRDLSKHLHDFEPFDHPKILDNFNFNSWFLFFHIHHGLKKSTNKYNYKLIKMRIIFIHFYRFKCFVCFFI